jgi:hypothetical protein
MSNGLVLETGIKDGVKYSVLSESKCPQIEILFDVYSKDRRKAKVLYENQKHGFMFSSSRRVLYEQPNGDFRHVDFKRTYGISKTCVIYSREVVVDSFGYKNKRFYRTVGKSMVQPNCFYLYDKFNYSGGESYLKDFIMGKFGWVRNLLEDDRVFGLSLNVIVRHKLYTVKSAMRHIFKVPYPVADMVSKNMGGFEQRDFLKSWLHQLPCLKNVENLREEFLLSQYFRDSTKFANSLGRKLNCSWGLKRLKIEHDKMAKEVVLVLLEFEPLRDLKVANVYLDFAEYSGVKLFKTNHELIDEGVRLSHCVGTYSGSVDNGKSAIYGYLDHTIELNHIKQKDKWVLVVGQIKGYDNSYPSVEVRDYIGDLVHKFNNNILKNDVKYAEITEDWDLPF